MSYSEESPLLQPEVHGQPLADDKDAVYDRFSKAQKNFIAAAVSFAVLLSGGAVSVKL